MENISEKIREIVLSFKQLPYLFVGTGLSMRYSNAPSWVELLKDTWFLVNEEDGTERQYKNFVRGIMSKLDLEQMHIDEDEKKYKLNPQLASEIKKQFNSKFYGDEQFKSKCFREEQIDEILDNGYDPFKFYISEKTKELDIKEELEDSFEVAYLMSKQNKIAGVITTNYDTVIEKIFPKFDVLVGQDNLLTSNTNNIFEIFKIHGSCMEPNSIVITSEDYSFFEEKLKYLTAKLLTIFVEHPVIFIGYGLGDKNIRMILEEIANCLNNTQVENLRKNLIFVKQSENGENEISNSEMNFGGKRIVMTEIKLKDYSILYKAFDEIKASLPIRIIRNLQDMVCNFIASTDIKNNILIGSVNDESIDESKMAIFVGTTDTISDIGFESYTLEDIIEDILFDNKPYFMSEKVLNTFQRIRSANGASFLPMHKYIKGLGLDKNDLVLRYKYRIVDKINTSTEYEKNRYVPPQPADTLFITTSQRKALNNKETAYKSFNDMVDDNLNRSNILIAYIIKDYNLIDTAELGEFLRNRFKDNEYWKENCSNMRKLVALYDYKRYFE